MGVLFDQGVLYLYLDTHKLGEREADNKKKEWLLNFHLKTLSQIPDTQVPPSFLLAHEGTLHQMPELRCRRNS